jgi:hypothetical protein
VRKGFAFPARGVDLFREALSHESEAEPLVNLSDSAVRQSLTALGGGKAAAVDCSVDLAVKALQQVELNWGHQLEVRNVGGSAPDLG